jgi:hypothetical protein
MAIPLKAVGGLVYLVLVVGLTILLMSLCSKADEERKAKDAACVTDLKCASEKAATNAGVYCRRPIEKLAPYSVKWAEDDKFQGSRWLDKSRGTLSYTGDSRGI